MEGCGGRDILGGDDFLAMINFKWKWLLFMRIVEMKLIMVGRIYDMKRSLVTGCDILGKGLYSSFLRLSIASPTSGWLLGL